MGAYQPNLTVEDKDEASFFLLIVLFSTSWAKNA